MTTNNEKAPGQVLYEALQKGAHHEFPDDWSELSGWYRALMESAAQSVAAHRTASTAAQGEAVAWEAKILGAWTPTRHPDALRRDGYEVRQSPTHPASPASASPEPASAQAAQNAALDALIAEGQAIEALSTARTAQAEPSVAAKLAEHVLHMEMATEKGRRARELARQVLYGQDEVLRLLDLIVHATAPTPDDDGGHENAHDLAVEAIAVLRGNPLASRLAAEAQGEAVAFVKRGPDTPWGHGTVLLAWGPGASKLPVGHHLVFASPPSSAAAQAVPPGFWLAPMEPDTDMIRAGHYWETDQRVREFWNALRDHWLARHPQAVPTTGGAQ